MKKSKKIFAVASLGGHRMQMLRIIEALPADAGVEYAFASTRADAFAPADSRLHGAPFYVFTDFSRRDAHKLLRCLWQAWRAIRHERPSLVITTGAAPGLMALVAARLQGIATVWIDSIANVERLSMSGKLASKIATHTLTQWPELAIDNIEYHGQVL